MMIAGSVEVAMAYCFQHSGVGNSSIQPQALDTSCVLQFQLAAGGQVISAVVGVCIRLALNDIQWLANALGMSLALVAMQLTGTTHPPGGATALIACSVVDLPPWRGFQLVVAVLLGSVELMSVALVSVDGAQQCLWRQL